VADAFRKEGRTEARAPKQPAQLSQAASVKDLVTYYDMVHSVGERLLSVVQDVLQSAKTPAEARC
jgi:hypothetical protein